MTVLVTPRLRLRHWHENDLPPFAAQNADPAVMEFMPRCLSRGESDDFARRAQQGIEARGWGLWAVEGRADGQFVGCVGLAVPSFTEHFTPCVEVLWRLQRPSWGHGYATEAARECVRFALETLALSEVVAFTVPANLRSRAVMERLLMMRNPRDDFDHPRLPPGHPLRRHVLYRLAREHWPGNAGAAATSATGGALDPCILRPAAPTCAPP
jgi:RimJ/RimL family protein N-acetyltransferase